MFFMYEEIIKQTESAVSELLDVAGLKKGDLFVVGCSSSEIGGGMIGKNSSVELADTVFDVIYRILNEKGIYLAAQCCEHLNRALIIERDYAVAHNLEIVNVVPQPKAGGSFATTCYKNFESPVAVEFVKADAGMDIGLTLIGMHLKHVAVPVRLSTDKIGCANVVFARTRPKCIGGIRAIYDDNLM